MLHLHFANRHETLTELLLARLGVTRGGVFDADQIIVSSAAMQRSLSLAMADRDGVCAHVEFDYLARWLWRQIARLVPGIAHESPFAPSSLTWRIYRALGDAAYVSAHPRLRHFLTAADPVMKFELAGQLARLFDQYITYRADWLQAWSGERPAGLGATPADDEAWQSALWRRLTAELGVHGAHPAQAFVEALRSAAVVPGQAARPGLRDQPAPTGLPGSAHLYALPSIPPLYLGMLQQLGRVMDLHVYAPNPCREHWFEVIDRRRLSRLAARGRAAGHEEGNRLLAGWGRQTQALVGMLVDTAGDGTEDDGCYEPNPGGTLLAALQNAVLDLTELVAGSLTLAVDDRSLELHSCHSLTRELEALQDHLLGLFAASGSDVGESPLQPNQILVVTPDLEAAAPLIDGVFGSAPADRHIPYAITGRPRSGVNVAARALLAVLDLAGSRVVASAVHGLLQQPLIARRFGLATDDLERVHGWIADSGMRWALDAAHRASFDLPAVARHTLTDGLDRLFLGYALPARVDEPFGGWLACGDAEGSEALALGAFAQCIDALQAAHKTLAVAWSGPQWPPLLLALIDTFLQPAAPELDDVRELQAALRELAESMQRGDATQPLPLAVVRAALQQLLDDPGRGGVPTGQVTFASMSSLRSLPYAVICVIGLNDGAYPTAARPLEFDLMSRDLRRGDRQRRDDERNQFLDLLLAARQCFYLSYTGRSARDNSALQPSVLVSELLEAVLPAITPQPADAAARAWARSRLVVEHPLQAFAAEGFDAAADPRLRSFNQELAAALQAGTTARSGRAEAGATALAAVAAFAAPSRPTRPAIGLSANTSGDDDEDEPDARLNDALQPAFFTVPLPAPEPAWREVSLAQLIEFHRQPCRYLLRRRLGLELQRDTDELQDDEPFLPDLPARSALSRRLLPQLLQGADPSRVQRLAQAGIELPAGAWGARQLDTELVTLTAFADRVRDCLAEPMRRPHQASMRFDLDGEAWSLHFTLADLRAGGLVRWRCDQLRANDALEAWLHHLALCVQPPAGVALRTRWLALDTTLCLKPVEQPQALLEELLRHYRQGLREPLHFFPKSAWAACLGGPRKAAEAWRSTLKRPHAESSDPAYRLALRGHGEPLNDDFFRLAQGVFGPLLQHLEAGTGGPADLEADA